MIANRARSTAFALAVAALSSAPLHATESPIEIAGRVLIEAGRPLAEARVKLLPLGDRDLEARGRSAGEPPETLSGTVTDAEGRFLLPAPGAGLYRVQVDAAGFVPMEYELTPLLDALDLPDLTLIGDLGLTVRVGDRSGGAPQTVRIHTAPSRGKFDRRSGWLPQELWLSSSDGSPIRVPNGRDAALSVSSVVDGQAPLKRASVRGRMLELTERSTKKFSIRVSDSEGRPAAGVSVFAEDVPLEIARTDDQGSATVGLSKADAPRVALVAEDGRRTAVDLSRVEPLSAGPDQAQLFPIRLPALRYVPGQAIDRDSRQGLADAVVWDRRTPRQGVRTDAQGGFLYRATEGSSLDLTAAAAGYLVAAPISFSLGDDGRPGPTFALARSSSVRGRVLDAGGRPVAEAEIRATVRHDGNSFRIELNGEGQDPETITAEDGSYLLEGLDPSVRMTLAIKAPGFVRQSRNLPKLKPGIELGGFDLTLAAGAAVVGRVTDEAGEPIAGAELVMAKSKPSGPGGMRMIAMGEDIEPYRDASDAQGSFRLSGIPNATFDLTVRSPGFAPSVTRGLEIADGEFDVEQIRLSAGEAVDGQVVDESGAPLAGVEVRLADGGGAVFMIGGPRDGGSPPPDAVTDPGGRFSLFDLSPDRAVNLRFRKASYIADSAKGVSVPQLEPLVVAMRAASTVSGQVLDAQGDPIPAASVTLRRMKTIEMGNMVMQTVAMEDTAADALGNFVFREQEPGAITLIATAPRFQEAERSDLTIPEGEDLEEIVLPLERGAIVEGRVLKPDGRPAIGAEVRKVGEGGGGPMHMAMSGNKTDGNGYFRLEGLSADRISIEATHKDFPRVVKDAELKVGINGLDLRFEGGQRVAGRVLDPSGKPVVSASVRLDSTGHRFGGPATVTGPDGRFEFEGVEDGSYRAEVQDDRFAGTEVDTKIDVEGAPVEGLELRLVRGGAIEGSLSGLAPEKFGKVSVRAEGKNYFSLGGRPVNSQGGYRLDRLKPGEYEVVATYEPTGLQAEGTVRLDPGVEQVRLDLRFADGIELTGIVSEDDAPIAGATVSVRHLKEDHSAWAQSDRAGRFKLEGLRKGRYRVTVQHWESGLNHSEEFEMATSRDVELKVPTGILEGTIVDSSDRRPLAGVTVSLDPQGESRGFTSKRVATSDVEGRFRLRNIGDGGWKMVAEKEGYAASRRDVEVQFEKSRAPLRLSMEPTEGISMKVRLPGGGIPQEVTLAVVDGAGETVVQGRYPTGEGGSVRVSTVPTGDWEIVVAGSGSAATKSRVRSPGQEAAIALQPATRLVVQVPELEGRGVRAKVRVYAADGSSFHGLAWNGRAQSVFNMDGGRLDFATLPPGNWRISVQTDEGGAWEGNVTTSPLQAATLSLDN